MPKQIAILHTSNCPKTSSPRAMCECSPRHVYVETANGRPLLPSTPEPEDEFERRTRG